jgi:RNA polymerase sigma factor (sigma-70 family)
MALAATSRTLQHLRHLVLAHDGGDLTDGQLLERFLVRHDEDAFTVLVRRHGRMVLGVCRRLLANTHDADDAFQATFLVLVRKAKALLSRQTVGDWLYGVAYHTALKARAAIRRRREMERRAADMVGRQPTASDGGSDWLPLLDQELRHLPEKYRVPVVLCDLEGKTLREAAGLLGWPQGTVAGRLSRARNLLARRLRRHGLVVSAGSLAALLTAEVASACVPAALARSTVGAATLAITGKSIAAGVISANVTALTEGVLQAMLLHKLKFPVVILLSVALAGAGVSFLAPRAAADKPTPADVKEKPREPRQGETSEVSVVLQAVDAAKRTLTVHSGQFTKGSKLVRQESFDVAPQVKIYLDSGTGGKLGFTEGTLADLRAGLALTLKLSADRKVIAIWAEGPRISGTIKAVDAARRTVTVAAWANKKGEGERALTIQVADDTRLTISDGKAKGKLPQTEARTLADLPVGAVVTARLSVDEKVAGSLDVRGPEVRGVVKAVDADKRRLTVQSGKDSEQTFTIPADLAIVRGDGKKGQAGLVKLADVPAGAQVSVQLSPDQKTVVSLTAEGASLFGTVKAVDAGERKITLTVFVSKGEPSEEKILTVARDAQVWIDGKESKLADLPVEAVVRVRLTLDQKAAGSIDAEGRSLYGVVTAVDAANGILTLTTGKGGDQTVALAAKEAALTIDGRPGKLADVPVESLASAKVSADQKTVLSLQVDGPSIKGTLKGVDAEKKVLTVTVPINKTETEDKAFELARDAQVATEIYGVPLTLTDLKAGREILLQLSADRKAVRRVTVIGE